MFEKISKEIFSLDSRSFLYDKIKQLIHLKQLAKELITFILGIED